MTKKLPLDDDVSTVLNSGILSCTVITNIPSELNITLFRKPIFVSWALRGMRESLLQMDPLSAAISRQTIKSKPLPTVSRTPLLLQFTPFGPPVPSLKTKQIWPNHLIHQCNSEIHVYFVLFRIYWNSFSRVLAAFQCSFLLFVQNLSFSR
ncbi:hypothetical protein DICVIV_12808 [Dictyocaulus viviparus]|uniref:Uncharacterized protein n=1 Tax=Dictyocaulus viviparus TaxID=29172 RepID=A0A0D8X9F9_DICVI|nr:hypothetical protein DICVIV_12808 [Dictyocaulus viviparus]